jgi:hypothetical protein
VCLLGVERSRTFHSAVEQHVGLLLSAADRRCVTSRGGVQRGVDEAVEGGWVLVPGVPVRESFADEPVRNPLGEQVSDLLGELPDGAFGQLAVVGSYPVDEIAEDELRRNPRRGFL